MNKRHRAKRLNDTKDGTMIGSMLEQAFDKGININDEIAELRVESEVLAVALDEELNGDKADTVKKLTSWKNEPKLEDLENDLNESASYQNTVKEKIQLYKENMEGGAPIDKQVGKSNVRPKLIRKQAEWRYPSLEEPFLSTKDMFKIEPRTWEDAKAAEQNAILLNYQWSTKIKKVKLVNDIVRTLVDEGTVVVKAGWEVEEGVKMVEKEVPDYASPEESMMMMQEAVAAGEMSEEEMMMMMQSGQPMQKGMKKVYEEETALIKNQPTYEVCNNANVIIDPTCEGDLDRATFIIHEFNTSYAELKKDEYVKTVEIEEVVDEITGVVTVNKKVTESGFYRNLKDVDVEQSIAVTDDYGSVAANTFKHKDKARKKIRAFEYWGYWDINGDGKLVGIVATWVGKTLIRLEENPFPHGKLPFASTQFMPKVREPHGEPDGALLIENQESIGKMVRAAHDITGQQAIGQKFIDEQLFPSPVQKDNYEKGKTVYFRHGLDPRMAIHKQSVDPIPQSVFSMIQMQTQDAESLTGTVSFGKGISGTALGSNATGIRSALDATSKRDLSILRRLSALFQDLGRLTISMNQSFLDEEEIVRVTNDEFVAIRRDDLAGDIDLSIDVSTPERDNEQAEKLNMLMQTNAASMDPEIAKVIYAKIAKLWKQPDVAQMIENIQPKEDPFAEQMKQLQMQEMQMKIQLLTKQLEEADSRIMERQSRATENESDILNKQAQTELRMAQAAKMKSEADLLDSKFVKDYSGEADANKTQAELAREEMRHQMKMKQQEHKRLSDLDYIAAQGMMRENQLKMMNQNKPNKTE